MATPFLGNCTSQTLYTLDVARRFVNIGGIANRFVRREHLHNALETARSSNYPVRYAAARGGLMARDLFSVISVPYDFVVGTGRHRLVPGEAAWADSLLAAPAAAPAFPPHRSAIGQVAQAVADPVSRGLRTWRLHRDVPHAERVAYLSNRVRQHLQHPCDIGLLGTAGLWATLPVYAAASMLGAAIGCVAATASYGVLALADKRPDSYSEFTTRWTGFVAAGAAVTMFGALTTAPAWFMLQGLRVAGAAAKAVVIAAGAGIGALVGLGRMYSARALAPASESGRDLERGSERDVAFDDDGFTGLTAAEGMV